MPDDCARCLRVLPRRLVILAALVDAFEHAPTRATLHAQVAPLLEEAAMIAAWVRGDEGAEPPAVL